MKIKNKKQIGFITIVVGIIIIVYIANITLLAFTGVTSSGKVSGFKVSAYGARKVPSSGTTLKGRSPYILFTTAQNKNIEAYSRIPQLLSLFSYKLNDEVSIKYNPNNPSQIFVLDSKELPGLFLVLFFGLLCCVVGVSYLKK